LILYFIIGKILPNLKDANVKAPVGCSQKSFTGLMTAFLLFGRRAVIFRANIFGEVENW
jgi:hypothetical protein